MLEALLITLAISKTIGETKKQAHGFLQFSEIELRDDYNNIGHEKIRNKMEQLGIPMEYWEDYVLALKARNARDKHNLENPSKLLGEVEYWEDYVIQMKMRKAREEHNLENPQQTGRKTHTYLVKTKTGKNQKPNHDMEIIKDYQDAMQSWKK